MLIQMISGLVAMMKEAPIFCCFSKATKKVPGLYSLSNTSQQKKTVTADV